MDNYLKILEESLRKKVQVLEELQQYNEKQRQVFESAEVKLEQFDEAIEQKGRLIDRITKLDEGFETLYTNVAKELEANKDKYAEQIRSLQQLVKQVTDRSMSVQAQEARNKALIEEYFSKERNGIRQDRINSKAAYEYYKKVNNTAYVPPQIFDNKK